MKYKKNKKDDEIKHLKDRIKELEKSETRYKLTEKSLQENESLLHQIINTSPNCIYVKDREGRYVLVNQRMANMHKTTPEALIGLTDLFLAEKWLTSVAKIEKFRAAELEVIDKKQMRFIPEEEFTFRDGTKRWFQTTKSPIILKNKQDYLMSVSVDITEHKKAEDELLLKDLVFEHSITANSISDNAGIITHINDTFIRLWGYESRNEAIGEPISNFLKFEDEAMNIITALNKTGVWEGEYTGLRKDKTTFTAYGLATIIKDISGDTIGYQSSVLDITERKKAEEELEKHRDHLEELVKERTAELEEKNKELIRFNKLFVGREFRVKELKDKVKELEEEAGRKKNER